MDNPQGSLTKLYKLDTSETVVVSKINTNNTQSSCKSVLGMRVKVIATEIELPDGLLQGSYREEKFNESLVLSYKSHN